MKSRSGTILITFDGVRRKEVFDKKILPYMNSLRDKEYVHVVNNMNVANKYKKSYPGYNDILTGKVDETITNNQHGYNKNINFFEKYNLEPILALAWKKFKYIYNIKRNKFRILNNHKTTRKIGKKFSNQLNKSMKSTKYKLSTRNCYKMDDCKIFNTFCYYWLKNRSPVKCGHLGFVGSDDWAHENDFSKYVEFLKYYDNCVEYIWENLLPETIIVTTDHSRGKVMWQEHNNNLPESNKVWCFIISKNKKRLDASKKLFSSPPINTDIYKLLQNFILG